MRSVILDIGAGSKYFARRLWWRNWKKPQLIFCGEPWERPHWKRDIDSHQIRNFIKNDKRGIFRIRSGYDTFDFEDASLDMVTLNAPHVLMPPRGIEPELIRCLKPGGIFFFSYPIEFGLSASLKEAFELLTRERFHDTSLINLEKVHGYPSHLPNVITPSSVMKYNIRENIRRKIPGYRNSMGMSYIYRESRLINGYEVWQKP